ncbi:Uncharacterised protein [Bifidobacterium longum subsp. infantis]|jgi:hypothetical protein|uniref:Phage protein n=3 Tax=Bifidobacterium longum TaxID=216816 RepID=A0ABP1X7T1_BIFLI|nr:hypothetical protein Blon_1805 [Bifidobacterium longum subsp. infantis ATCC 15697 = JCM 1222 = DSM 20088]CEE99969.1 hypothetical protein BLIC_a01964 [Bifidobacterium longum subsp. infantis]DAL82896.1 MAG TPA: hypothetical protein [Caudoviricetes sp.]CEF02962.1 hypothetical protein BLIC_b01975 [Bifidobacterium longum subsp. infantis]CEF04304.1 hypothetical protein BLIC_c01975 [Bifidobacterium longum subsp. infantis]
MSDMRSFIKVEHSRFTQGGTVTYKAKIFTREQFGNVIAAAIYDYEHSPAKCLYTTNDTADKLYDRYGTETEAEE